MAKRNRRQEAASADDRRRKRVRWTAGYRPLAGVPDEMIDAGGTIRPVWQPLHRGARRARPGGAGARASPAPTSICATPASSIATTTTAGAQGARLAAGACAAADRRERMAGASPHGLVQRADLLEAIVADIYGENRLVARRPAAARADRPQPGIPAPDGRHQAGRAATSCISAPSSSAAARTATGGCWATAPRRRPAPASRWRTASRPTRAFSDIYGEMHVHRLAGFFRRFRDALQAQSPNEPTAASPS